MRARGAICLRGPLSADRVTNTLNAYSAFVLPSSRESFGMAFIEALFAGIPVLYPAGWAIDGFFDADRIGYACDAHDASDVLRGLKHLLAHEARLKRSIQTLQEKGGLDMFRSEKILSLYNNQLNKALASS